MHLAAVLAALTLAQPAPTTDQIRVFSDQLPDGKPPALVGFAATHYAGAQKLGASLTDALKQRNPQFFAIQSRLGLGLGRKTQIRFGDTWVNEWPQHPKARWFYRWKGKRVFQRWGWYLMNPDDASWRPYWVAQERKQVATTHADGVFMDSTRARVVEEDRALARVHAEARRQADRRQRGLVGDDARADELRERGRRNGRRPRDRPGTCRLAAGAQPSARSRQAGHDRDLPVLSGRR